MPSVAGSISIVERGRALATIVYDPGESAHVREAAGTLADMIRQSTGASLPLAEDPGPATGVTVHLGNTSRVKQLSLDLEELDADGFVIGFPDQTTVVIMGATVFGTQFGVSEFLERYVGVRWLFPGRLGLHIPVRETLSVPTAEVRQEPAFWSRLLSGPILKRTEPEYVKWAPFNRMHGRLSFHHNLLNLFPPEVYVETHPEFFPVINGRRVLPTDRSDHGWQPDFGAAGIVEEAVKNICGYFAGNPSATSYSLGINDSNAFGKEADRTNSVGAPDMSDYYYAWTNKVMAGVLEKYPDKWFGCLAYAAVTDPPRTVQVDPRMIPCICFDRMMWYDPATAERDKARALAWNRSSPVLGWYDYIYGDEFYAVPRVYFQLMADYLRFGYEHGARVYYAEAYANDIWLEGPKLYLNLKLLWNPYLDVDDALNDWYRAAVGEKAAPHLRAYFEFWEGFWRERVPETDWFKKGTAGIYLDFHSRDYLECLREDDLVRCGSELRAAADNAATKEQRERAEFFLSGFAEVKRRAAYDVSFLALNKTPPAGAERLIFADDFAPGQSPAAVEQTPNPGPDWSNAGMPTGWSSWQHTHNNAKCGWDTAAGRTAPGSLTMLLEGCGGGPVCILKYVRLSPGNVYHVAWWLKTEGIVEDGATVELALKWRDGSGAWVDRFSLSKALRPLRDGEWQRMHAYFRAPDIDGPSLVLMLAAEKSHHGRAWLDDVSMHEIATQQEQ